jgi:hypothetical protein
MDKSDLVILWRGQLWSTGANPEQCASGWWGLSFGGKKSVKDLTPHPARPDSFSPSLRPRCFALRMALAFASGSFRIWQVSAGCPQPFPRTPKLSDAGWASPHLPTIHLRRSAYLKLLKATGHALAAVNDRHLDSVRWFSLSLRSPRPTHSLSFRRPSGPPHLDHPSPSTRRGR